MSALTRRGLIGAAAAVALAPRLASAAPFREGHLDVGGGRLWHWDTGGAGEPLVLLHPGTGSHDSWVAQRDVLARAGYRVIAYARWGYAPSDKPPAVRRPELEDLRAVLDALRLDRAHLVGVAAGSGIVAPFVAAYPQRVRSAALFSSLLGISDPWVKAEIDRLRPKGFGDLPSEFRELGPSYRVASPEGVKRWLEIEHRRAPLIPPEVRTSTTLGALAATRRPLLLATGDADLFSPPALMRKAAGLLPDATYRTIDDSGHAPFWEQPEQFNRALLGFLQNLRKRKGR